MQTEIINEIVSSQRKLFNTGITREKAFRLRALKSLRNTIIEYEQEIVTALEKDLKKPLFESYGAEIGLVLLEINYAIKNLGKWLKWKKAKKTPLLFSAKNFIISEPFGVALIISPWNFPFQLTFLPLVGAIAAGNCCVVKPSETTVATSGIISRLLSEAFDKEHIAVVEGGPEIAGELLEQKFDKIFFTGSSAVGKIVMEKAARNLTPVTLEMGGKSPCIVDKNINVDITAKNILWGKFFNTGQTCIAPDYLLVHSQIKQELEAALIKWLRVFFGPDPSQSPDYGRIINKKHYRRLVNFLNEGNIIAGGQFDEDDLYIAPTIIETSDLDAAVMQEEIFGPILPVFEYRSSAEVGEIIARNPDPLSFFIFSSDSGAIDKFINDNSFGGGSVNDTLLYYVNQNLPFGGRGKSGIGSYRGKHTFDAFSHKKTISRKGFHFDFNFKYPPYRNKHRLLKKFLFR